eukprot:Ihof_evm9s59 gene=Ihof_evmTU9s59
MYCSHSNINFKRQLASAIIKHMKMALRNNILRGFSADLAGSSRYAAHYLSLHQGMIGSLDRIWNRVSLSSYKIQIGTLPLLPSRGFRSRRRENYHPKNAGKSTIWGKNPYTGKTLKNIERVDREKNVTPFSRKNERHTQQDPRQARYTENGEKKPRNIAPQPRDRAIYFHENQAKLNEPEKKKVKTSKEEDLTKVDWTNYRKKRHDLTPATNGPLEDKPKFSESKILREDITTAMTNTGVEFPTSIQLLAIPQIIQGGNVLCAAETGSGKTLSYLAPILSVLKDDEIAGQVTRLCRPRALILLPSQELATQILGVTRAFSRAIQLHTIGLFNTIPLRTTRTGLLNPVDVLVATPQQLVYTSDLRYIVLDEADTLFDPSFCSVITDILKPILMKNRQTKMMTVDKEGINDDVNIEGQESRKDDVMTTMPNTNQNIDSVSTNEKGEKKKEEHKPTNPQRCQVIVTTATVTVPFVEQLTALVPDIVQVNTLNLHKSLINVRQRFIKTRTLLNEKRDTMIDLLEKRAKQKSAMVFCNTTRCSDWLSAYLEGNKVPNIKLNGSLDPKERAERLKEFRRTDGQVMVCTDVASRGIDILAVSHVYNFDFPTNVTDYLHRSGRTGRLGKPGEVVSLYTNRELALADKIHRAVIKDKTLAGLFKEITKTIRPIKIPRPAT